MPVGNLVLQQGLLQRQAHASHGNFLGRPVFQHVPRERADQGFRHEPRDERQAEVHPFLAPGRNGGGVLIKFGRPRNFAHRHNHHACQRHQIVRPGDVSAIPLPRQRQRKQGKRRHHRAINEHAEYVELVGDGDEEDQSDHNADGIDGIERAYGRVRADRPQPILRHEQIQIRINGAHAQDQPDQHQQPPERWFPRHLANCLQRRLALDPGFLFLRLRRLVRPHELIFAPDNRHPHPQAQRRQHHAHREDVGVGQMQQLAHDVNAEAGRRRADVHEQVPEVESRAARAPGREPPASGLKHGLNRRHEGGHQQQQHAGDQPPVRQARGQSHHQHAQPQHQHRRHRKDQGTPDPQPVGVHPRNKQHQRRRRGEDRRGIARPPVVQPQVFRQKHRRDGQQRKVKGAVQEIHHLDAPILFAGFFQHAKIPKVSDHQLPGGFGARGRRRSWLAHIYCSIARSGRHSTVRIKPYRPTLNAASESPAIRPPPISDMVLISGGNDPAAAGGRRKARRACA